MSKPTVDLEAFCEREYPRLVGTLGLYCGNVGVAQELAQEALAKACANWSRVGEMAAPGAWVHRVGINLAHSRYRRAAAERRVMRRAAATAQPNVEDQSEAIAVREAVSKLPARQRTAIILRYWVGLHADEVGDILGTSPANVHQLCHRAVERLRAELGVTIVPKAGEASDVH